MRYYSILLISLLILNSPAQGQELSSANDYSQRGISRFEKNDLDGAIADFTKVIEMYGKNQELCYSFRAMAYGWTGTLIRASNDLSKALAI